MSLFGYLAETLGLSTDEPNDPLDELERLLTEREPSLNLSATFSTPTPNMQDEPTVLFPYTVFDSNGNEYGAGNKEFILPDNGLDDTHSTLVQFVAEQHDIDAEDVTFDDVAAVEGTTANVHLNAFGDIEVGGI